MRGNRPDGPRRAPSSSERALTYVIILGVAAGVLMLGGLGVYGFITYFSGDDLDTADAPSGEGTEVLAASPTALAAGIQEEFGQQSPTDSIAATATAACDLFVSQFPGTPCPPIDAPEIEATATAACEEFMSQFPGTPCP